DLQNSGGLDRCPDGELQRCDNCTVPVPDCRAQRLGHSFWGEYFCDWAVQWAPGGTQYVRGSWSMAGRVSDDAIGSVRSQSYATWWPELRAGGRGDGCQRTACFERCDGCFSTSPREPIDQRPEHLDPGHCQCSFGSERGDSGAQQSGPCHV